MVPPEELEPGVCGSGRRARVARPDAIRDASDGAELALARLVIHLHAGAARRALSPLRSGRQLHGRRDVIPADARADPLVADQRDVPLVTRRVNLDQRYSSISTSGLAHQQPNESMKDEQTHNQTNNHTVLNET